MGYKCICGRYYISPIPHQCTKCHAIIPGGTFEGDAYQSKIVKRPIKLVRNFGIKRPVVLERLPLDDGHWVEFLSEDSDGDDTGNLPVATKKYK